MPAERTEHPIELVPLYGAVLELCARSDADPELVHSQLQKIEEHGPVKILWRLFFAPRYLFLAAVRCQKIGADHKVIFNGIQNWPATMWRDLNVPLDPDGRMLADQFITGLPDARERERHWHAFIEHLVEQGALEEALERIGRSEWLGQQCFHLLSIAKAFCREGRRQEAEQAMARVMEALQQPERLNDRVHVSDEIRLRLAHIRCEQGQTDEAMELVGEMGSGATRCDAFIRIAKELGKRSEKEKAHRTYRRAAQEAFAPENECPDAYLPWISAGVAALGLDDEAARIMPRSWMVGESHSRDILLRELSEAGRFDECIQVVDDINDPWQKIDDLLTIATSMRAHGKETDAHRLVNDVIALLPGSRNGGWDRIASTLASFGRFKEAFEVIEGIDENLVLDDLIIHPEELQAWALPNVLKEMCALGKVDLALERVRQEEDHHIRMDLLITLAEVLLDQGSKEFAMALAEEALPLALGLDGDPFTYDANDHNTEFQEDSFKQRMLGGLTRIYERLGEWGKATQLLKEMAKQPVALLK